METTLFIIAGMSLVFPELTAAILGLGLIKPAYPHVIALALAGFATLMQWMRPESAQQGSRS